MSGMSDPQALSLALALGDMRRGVEDPFGFCEQLAQLDQQHFQWPWAREQWSSSLENSEHYALGVLLGSHGPQGLALFHVPDRQGTAHLLKFLLCPPYRGRGLAERFFKLCQGQLEKWGVGGLYLEVEETNAAAIGLYAKCGLKTLTRKKDFYGTGRHGLAMGSMPQGE